MISVELKGPLNYHMDDNELLTSSVCSHDLFTVLVPSLSLLVLFDECALRLRTTRHSWTTYAETWIFAMFRGP
jgi:hypothetical protein